MAKIRIVGDSSGYVELAAPNAAGNNTLELPSNATKLVGADESNNLNVTGISTLNNVVVGGATTALVVNGDARITGILTIGTSSITLDGSSNQVNVGTGVTLHHTNGVQVGANTLHSSGLFLNNLNVGTGGTVITTTAGGFVGIGTTNPTSPLEVQSSTIPRIISNYNNSKHIGMSVGGGGGGFTLTDGHFLTINHQPYADRGTDNNLTERVRIGTAGLVDCKYGVQAPKAWYYSNSYTTSSTWNSGWNTVIPTNALGANATYLVTLFWNYNGYGGSPYYLNAATLLSTVPGTNGSSTENAVVLLSGTHTGGTGTYLQVRTIAQSGGGTTGLQVNIAGFSPVSGSLMYVYVQQLAY